MLWLCLLLDPLSNSYDTCRYTEVPHHHTKKVFFLLSSTLKTLLWIHGYPSCVSQSNAKRVSWAFLLLAPNSKISRFCKEKKKKKEAKYCLKGSFYEQIEYVPLSATFELQKINNNGSCISLSPTVIETKLQSFAASPVLSSGGCWQHLLSPVAVCPHTSCPKDEFSCSKRQKIKKKKIPNPHIWEESTGSGSGRYTSEMCEPTKAQPWVIPILHHLAFKLLPVEFNRHNRK